MIRRLAICAALIGAAVFSSPALALSSKECSAKYQAAKAAGTLGTTKYADFRKAECGPGAAPVAGSSPPGAPAAPVEPPTARAPRPAPSPGAGNTGQAVFPATIPANCSADKSAGKARMCACLAQYNANKTNGGNGGLKWIQKGGGYYSECNKRLKGSA